MEIENSILRLLDANINRLKEGLRVIEDINRYIFNDRDVSKKIKCIRHSIRVDGVRLVDYRDINSDVLKDNIASESTRVDVMDILESNFRRCFESLRVLEEFFKLDFLSQYGMNCKAIRYELYGLHKGIINKYF